jgi:L-amino acid N-acyltransferase YncA
MKSIREVCAADYTADEISAWAGRSFDEAKWNEAVSKHSVWVVEISGQIEGHGYWRHQAQESSIFLHSLYFTKRAMGRGFGSQILEKLFEEARSLGISKIKLESTLTSHEFYKKLGFSDTGPIQKVVVQANQCPVRCIPMELDLSLVTTGKRGVKF